MTAINFELIDGGTRGRLLGALQFQTTITGYSINHPEDGYYLDREGLLTLYVGFTWDFGSCAVDTPAMVIASAAHDAFCVMTDKGLLPWSVRAQSDYFFRELLKQHGVGFSRRWWCWAGVRSYSKTVAYWNRRRNA